MRKIFLLAGELSGDKLAAWYVKRLQQQQKDLYLSGIGGNFLEGADVELYERFEKLNVVGIVEIVKHLRFLLRFLNRVVDYIIEQNFDEVVVVDFPGFNLRLIKKLKKLRPDIKVTYLSPPQLWIWGAWRVRKIKRFCDEVIVLYPFEVEWYKKRGVNAKWLSYPFYDRLGSFVGGFNAKKKHVIALIPGSRLIEIKRLLPLFVRVVRRFKLAHPGVQVVLPLAESIDREAVEKVLRDSVVGRNGLNPSVGGHGICIVQGEDEKLKALSSCCLALTKPGTITLELGLLSVPAVVAYKASLLTYVIARLLVKVKYMSLVNLLLGGSVYPECIQFDCTEKKIGKELETLYSGFVNQTETHQALHEKLGALKNILSG